MATKTTPPFFDEVTLLLWKTKFKTQNRKKEYLKTAVYNHYCQLRKRKIIKAFCKLENKNLHVQTDMALKGILRRGGSRCAPLFLSIQKENDNEVFLQELTVVRLLYSLYNGCGAQTQAKRRPKAGC